MKVNYSMVKNTEFADGMIEVYTKAFLSERIEWGLATDRPIFIV